MPLKKDSGWDTGCWTEQEQTLWLSQILVPRRMACVCTPKAEMSANFGAITLHITPTSNIKTWGTDFAAYNYFIICYTVPPVLYALLYPYQTKFSDTKPFISKIKNAMQLKNLSWNILSNFWPTLINEFVASSPTVWWVRNYFYKIIFSVPAFFFFFISKNVTSRNPMTQASLTSFS